MKSFFQRHNWTLRRQTSIAQMLPADLEEKMARFRQDVYHVRQNGDFSYDLIANMDETPVFFDMVPSCVVEKIGEKSVRVRSTNSDKRRITAVLACTASGKMLPPMIIFKGTTTRTLINVKANSEDTCISYQNKAWVDDPKWFGSRRRGRLCFFLIPSLHTLQQQFRVPLLQRIPLFEWSLADVHLFCNPLNVSLNKPVKAILRESWNNYILEQ